MVLILILTVNPRLNKGFGGRRRPSYANARGLNGQESLFCGAVFVA
jgi:hypothetical protein